MGRDAIAGTGVLDAGAALLDDAGELVAGYERETHIRQDAAADPEIVVAESGALHPEHHLVLPRAWVRSVGQSVLTRCGRVQAFMGSRR